MLSRRGPRQSGCGCSEGLRGRGALVCGISKGKYVDGEVHSPTDGTPRRTFEESRSDMQLQGDTSGCAKPPVDFKTKVPLLPGQARAGKAKTELLFLSQREVLHNLMCHPVEQKGCEKS